MAPQILGMGKILSDESLRRALARLAPDQGRRCDPVEREARARQLARTTEWMDGALAESSGEALLTPWILDTDTTVKVLYGSQKGAEVGYNPTKPGRPSHTLHTYWIGNLRLVVDVEVQSGKKHAGTHSLPRLGVRLEQRPPEKRPALVRGDAAFGNEVVMSHLEGLAQRYLFKLRQTPGARRLIERLWRQSDWQDIGQGLHAAESPLRLAGWSQARRVIVLRRRLRSALLAEADSAGPQQTLQFIDRSEAIKLWEYEVLVTNGDHSLEAIGQLYRDRADSENGFDELKNQWGWGGYTTHDLERCNLSARAVALIYNWWNWYVRLAEPKKHLEAITSRPLLLTGVARLTRHAGQARLLVTLCHAAGDHIRTMIARIRKGLSHVLDTAPQLPKHGRWPALMRYIIDRILSAKPKVSPAPALAPSHLTMNSA